jgi:cation diffusion facilitator CzcD-associated flavoprotein CzcO
MELLVIGAGPYGLAVAAEARRRGLSVTVVGEPMRFWRRNMPDGMLLRSGRDWHLDAAEVHTFDAFTGGEEIDPIPVETFIAYADWFCAQNDLAPIPTRVNTLIEENGGFTAHVDDAPAGASSSAVGLSAGPVGPAGASVIRADRVVAAPGIASFAVEPAFVTERLAPERWSHTVRTVDFAGLAGHSVLILGGRQSAFEWAALLAEAGAERVDVVYRHDTPAFTESDWSFVGDLLAETRRTRGWFRGLPEAERRAIAQRFWQVGRLQLEPWLAPRIAAAHLHPRTEIADLQSNGAITAELTDGTSIEADHLLLATGYAPDMTRVPYLPPIELADGFPVLDPDFQTSIPGLYIPGFPSTRDFGPFFGFVAGATTTAHIIGDALSAR